jgi:hypothetical protein
MEDSFSIVAYPPIVRQADEAWHETLQTQAETYTISDGVGFDTAQFTLTGNDDYLSDWFEKGLVHHVTWTAPDGSIAWEGWINRMALSIGDSVENKSVDDMANRILLYYVPLDTAETPAVAGAQTLITKNDTASQARYGVKTMVVSGGECTAATADDNAFTYLDWHNRIPQTETIAVGRGKQFQLQVQMRGYAYMANWYHYNQTASSGTVDADAMVGLALAADPNGVLSTSTLNIDSNTTATEQYRDDNPLAWKMIQELAVRGFETGGTGYRWSCGVYEDRRTTFKAAEGLTRQGVELGTNKHPVIRRYVRDEADLFVEDGGRELETWELRPDRLLVKDGVPGTPRYITQVKWQAPRWVTLQGTDQVDPFRRMLSEECR